MKKLISCCLAVALLGGCGVETTEALSTVEHALTATAVYDPTYQAPLCANLASACSMTTSQVANAGSGEANSPNTSTGCGDAAWRYGVAIDRLTVSSGNSSNLTAGRSVTATLTFREASIRSSDVDVFIANDADAPVWTLLQTFQPTTTGAQSKTLNFTLDGGGSRRALRAQLRPRNVSSAPCSPGIDDTDELVFTVGAPLPLNNPGFDTSLSGWIRSGNVTWEAGHAAFRPAYPNAATLSQQTVVPAGASTMTIWYRVDSINSATMSANLTVQVTPMNGSGLLYRAFASNLTTSPTWQAFTMDVSTLQNRAVSVLLRSNNSFTDNWNVFRVDGVQFD